MACKCDVFWSRKSSRRPFQSSEENCSLYVQCEWQSRKALLMQYWCRLSVGRMSVTDLKRVDVMWGVYSDKAQASKHCSIHERSTTYHLRPYQGTTWSSLTWAYICSEHVYKTRVWWCSPHLSEGICIRMHTYINIALWLKHKMSGCNSSTIEYHESYFTSSKHISFDQHISQIVLKKLRLTFIKKEYVCV